MQKTASIPAWYTEDWTPAQSRWEWPQMSWDAVEASIDASLLNPRRKTAAHTLFRRLWLESSTLAPMDLLQRFLIAAAHAYNPARMKSERMSASMIPTPATGPMPRWSYTDIEVALSYTWSGTALFVAQERHHDLLARRGDTLSPQEAVRQVILLTAGLPTTSFMERIEKEARARPARRAA